MLELRIWVVLNHQRVVGVLQLNVEERSEVAYLRTHRQPDSRDHSGRVAIQPDISVLPGSEKSVMWFFQQHLEPLIFERYATKKFQISKSGEQ